jgi:hypothetical protein
MSEIEYEAVRPRISLYDASAAWTGGSMAESAYDTASGTEISERSKELVLPGDRVPALSGYNDAPGRTAGLSDSAEPVSQTSASATGSDTTRSGSGSKSNGQPRIEHVAVETDSPRVEVAERGVALPGDRGPRVQAPRNQRPSFWRRIALGARREPDVELARADAAPANSTGIEQRIVEPMLQALVSVESKLERSHIELTKRSDQIEQRLTQLWDIEEQLGSLGELQESLLQVSEQQRRLESAIENQTRTMRWMVGGVFFSLAIAAFVVAALLR